jgi:hypothetical protein
MNARLTFLSFCNVTDRGGDRDAVPGLHGAETDLYRKARAVLPFGKEFQAKSHRSRLAGVDESTLLCRVFMAALIRHECIDT